MRLTEKKSSGKYELTETAKLDLQTCLYTQVEQKLGQLEDIEDELGIDLVTLFKALKNGVYVKKCGEIKKFYIYQSQNSILWFEGKIKAFEGIVYYFNWRENLYINEEQYIKDYKIHPLYKQSFNQNIYNETYLYLNEYGKTWALTKEELL